MGLIVEFDAPGLTRVVVCCDASGQVWSTVAGAFVAFANADIADYALSIPESPASSGRYEVQAPTGTTRYLFCQQAGASFALADLQAWLRDVGIVEGVAEAERAAAAAAVRTNLTTELARIDAAVGSRAVAGDAMTLADAEDVYHADIAYVPDQANSRDEYAVTWMRNGVAIAATSPTIRVISWADGSDLVAEVAMTEIVSGTYKHTETASRIPQRQIALVVVTATIGGGLRTAKRLVRRGVT